MYSLFIFYTSTSNYDFRWRGVAAASIIPLSIYMINYFISRTIKTRLIYKIQENDDNIVLTIYNKSTISFEKALMPLEKEQPDYFLNTLFSSRMGTIHQDEAYKGTSIIKINGKKYYLTPNLFEKEVTI
jgi:hypothetical protein